MEFGLSEEQVLLQDSVSKFLEGASDIEQVRQALDGKGDDSLWQGLNELGANAALVPEEYDGMGLSLLDAALIQEMLGRFVVPAAFAANAMATTALVASGTEGQKRTWLPKIADGSARFGIAVSERTGAREGADVTDNDGKLTGKALFVTGFEGATDFIVADNLGKLHMVSADAAGLTKANLPTIDKTRLVGELKFDNVQAHHLSTENEPGKAADRVIAAGRILAAADTLGAGTRMIEKAVDYARERKQFNRIIGSFQAVKHLCAEMAAELEPCRSLVWYAAHAFDTVPEEASLMACHAKSHLSEVGQFVARTSTEVHGGVGFTDLMGLHFWFKRIGLNRQLYGGPERVRDEAARLQGWVST